MLKTYVLIPARLNSKRLPRKMLLAETGTPLIKHTYDRIRGLTPRKIDRIFVVTPDDEIERVCNDWRMPVIKIREGTLCGTHSCVLAAQELGLCNIINLQGDYPLVHPDTLSRISEWMYQKTEICSAYYQTNDDILAENPSNVKVVRSDCDYAHYFSRAQIPYGASFWNIHIGVYGLPYLIHRKLLAKYEHFPSHIYESSLKGEGLEQLMWLDNGEKIKMLTSRPCLGIDTREDYDKFKEHWEALTCHP